MGFITKLGLVVIILSIFYAFFGEYLGLPLFLGSEPSFSGLDLTTLILFCLGVALLIIAYAWPTRHPPAH